MDFKKEITEVLDKIKTYFAAEETPENKARTLDGSFVAWDGEILGVGTKFYVLSSEGKVSAETGEYELENGDIVLVESGTVKDVLAKMHEEMNDFNPQEFKSEVETLLNERLTALETKLSEQMQKLEEAEKALATQKQSEFEAVMSAITSLQNELSNLSVESPARETRTEFSEQPTSKYAAYFKEIKAIAAEREAKLSNTTKK